MTLRAILGLTPKPHPTRPLPLVEQPFTLSDPATFPCAFLAIPETDLRSDR